MGLYATPEEIQDESPNIKVLANAQLIEVNAWGQEAFEYLNSYCNQSFAFEAQATYTTYVGTHPTVYLPKVVSGDITVYSTVEGEDPVLVDPLDLEFVDYDYSFRYLPRNVTYPSSTRIKLEVTGDFGYPLTVEERLVAFANGLKTVYTAHLANTDAHLVADAVNTIAAADATALASVYTLLNEIKADYNLHIVSDTYHLAEGTATVTDANASTQATALTLASALKDAFNLHLADTDLHSEEDEAICKYTANTTILPSAVRMAFMRITRRVAIRDNSDDHRYHNSGYLRESWSDGYSYDVSDPVLRSIIHPTETMLLSEYVHHGEVVL